MIYDAHIHLAETDLNISDITFLSVCDSKQAYLKLKEKKCDIAIGIHPLNLNSLSFKELEEIVKNKDIKAIGEVGLDYRYPNKDEQASIFLKQILLANKYHKPLIVHSIKASNDTYTFLKQAQVNILLHNFEQSLEMIKTYDKNLDGKAYYSFGFNLLKEGHIKSKQALKAVKQDRLLLESDYPYNGDISLLKELYQYVADTLNLEIDELSSLIKENYINFLKGE